MKKINVFNITKVPLDDRTYLVTVNPHSTDHLRHDWRNKEHSFNVIQKSTDDGIISLPCNWKT